MSNITINKEYVKEKLLYPRLNELYNILSENQYNSKDDRGIVSYVGEYKFETISPSFEHSIFNLFSDDESETFQEQIEEIKKDLFGEKAHAYNNRETIAELRNRSKEIDEYLAYYYDNSYWRKDDGIMYFLFNYIKSCVFDKKDHEEEKEGLFYYKIVDYKPGKRPKFLSKGYSSEVRAKFVVSQLASDIIEYLSKLADRDNKKIELRTAGDNDIPKEIYYKNPFPYKNSGNEELLEYDDSFMSNLRFEVGIVLSNK